jgi:L,D-transpeptidase ErfK/SrfK
MNKTSMLLAAATLWCSMISIASGLTFAMQPGSDIVGTVQTVTVMPNESFSSIGQKFDVGIYELIESNPDVDPREPEEGTVLVIPTQFILPHGQRKGIVINLAEMRIYYFHKDNLLVTTHPIGIGRPEWETPVGRGKVVEKTKDPSWRPPKSIRAYYDAHNKYLPDIVPPGPENPLGKFALRLSIPGYLIHGTNMPGGIGIRSSSGCIRMFPEDIESLFHKVTVGDPVRIINKPYKIGFYHGQVYIEAHDPLSGDYYQNESASESLGQAIEEAAMAGAIDIGSAERAAERSHGYPTLIE